VAAVTATGENNDLVAISSSRQMMVVMMNQ
jgi:hypothetical protein